MAEQQQKPQNLVDRLRQLLENLEKALKPTPQAPEPVPVRTPRHQQ